MKKNSTLVSLIILLIVLAACSDSSPTSLPSPTPIPAATADVGRVSPMSSPFVATPPITMTPIASRSTPVNLTPTPTINSQPQPTPDTQLLIAKGDGSWTFTTKQPLKNLTTISCPSVSTCFVGDSLGNIFVSTDSGQSWQQHSIGVTAEIIDLACTSIKICYATANASTTGPKGSILATSDGGNTWKVQISDVQKYLAAITCPDSANCFVVGGQGTILSTSDGGLNWITYGTHVEEYLTSVTCFSVRNCFAAGSLNDPRRKMTTVFLSTSDSGRNWTTFSDEGWHGFDTINCPAANFCLAIGHLGGDVGGRPVWFYSSNNGGKTWHEIMKVTNFGPGYINPIVCPNATTCYIPQAETIVITNDGGRTWGVQYPGAAPHWIQKMSCPAVNKCYGIGTDNYVTNYSSVIMTTNGRQLSPLPATATPFPTFTINPSEKPVTISGIFGVRTAKDNPADTLLPGSPYPILTNSGNVINAFLEEKQLEALGGIDALRGKSVTVTGHSYPYYKDTIFDATITLNK